MGAVGPPPDPVLTVEQGGLSSFTVDIVQEDQADALAKRAIWYNLCVTPNAREESLGKLSKTSKLQME